MREAHGEGGDKHYREHEEKDVSENSYSYLKNRKEESNGSSAV